MQSLLNGFPHKTGVFFLFILFFLFKGHAAGVKFSESPRMKSFLNFPRQERILAPEAKAIFRALAKLRLQLDRALSEGKETIGIKKLGEDYSRREQSFIEYLEQNKIMRREGFLKKIRQEIEELQKQQATLSSEYKEKESRRRDQVNEMMKYSVIDGTCAIFHPIEPGNFEMNENLKEVKVTLTKPFDIMATPTTQIIWRKVAELARQRFPEKYEINENPSKFQGDSHPVESVSFNDVQIWIRALNELSERGVSALYDLIPGHKSGDIYRLPTEAEWEFVVRGRGEYNDHYHFGNQESELKKYAWFEDNSQGQTRPVAKKLPLVIDEKEIYDMHGNVYEWVQDWFQITLSGGTDPQGPQQGTEKVVRGGSWFDDNSYYLRSGYRYSWSPDTREFNIGFRLVRDSK